jgi:hypothetical protein
MPRTKKYQSNGERQAAYRRRCAQVTDVGVSGTVSSVLGRRRWGAMVNKALLLLDCTASEMQEYFEAHSESWQESQAGESLAEMLELVQGALASLEDIASQTRPAKPVIT